MSSLSSLHISPLAVDFFTPEEMPNADFLSIPTPRQPPVHNVTIDVRQSFELRAYVFRLKWRSNGEDFGIDEATHDEMLYNLRYPPSIDLVARQVLHAVEHLVNAVESADEFHSVVVTEFHQILFRAFNNEYPAPQHYNCQCQLSDPLPSSAAVEKSKELLLSLLNKQQKEEFLKTGCFSVAGPNEPLSIQDRYNFSVQCKTTRMKYCLVVPGVPIYDQMAALKLLIESDPEEFFQKANLRA